MSDVYLTFLKDIWMRNTKAAKEEHLRAEHRTNSPSFLKARTTNSTQKEDYQQLQWKLKIAQDSTRTTKALSGNKSKLNICHLSWCLNNYQKEHKKLHGNEPPLSPPPLLHYNKRRSWGHCEGCLYCWNDKNRTAGSGSDNFLKAELWWSLNLSDQSYQICSLYELQKKDVNICCLFTSLHEVTGSENL